ncbi:MAG: glucosaminidase domain-containing protein [Lachnospiraceae bacterium]|nr:glucosaminidase domain-containing protein [Lachnospiraceae bacterium]
MTSKRNNNKKNTQNKKNIEISITSLPPKILVRRIILGVAFIILIFAIVSITSKCRMDRLNSEVPGLPSFMTAEMVRAALKEQAKNPNNWTSVSLAQIIIESGFGNYGPGGETGNGLSQLAYEYKNLYGIKGTGPEGTIDFRTGEQTLEGERYEITAGFRVYSSYTQCIEDRTKVLSNTQYYDLSLGTTPEAFVENVLYGTWATSLSYNSSLLAVMSEFNLYRFDTMSVKEFDEEIKNNN